MKQIITLFVIAFLVTACDQARQNDNKKSTADRENGAHTDSSKTNTKNSEVKPAPFSIIKRAKALAEDFQQKDFGDRNSDQFASSILFAPYATIDTTIHRQLSLSRMQSLFNDTTRLVWGIEDGTGDTIRRSFAGYVDRYVTDFNLNDERVSVQQKQSFTSRGNEINNLKAIYPNSIFVEFHQPADDDMGMNWRSLIFVFTDEGAESKLQAVVHNEWTI